MTSVERRIRNLEEFRHRLDSDFGFLGDEFRVFAALLKNLPRVWPDRATVPKFLDTLWRQADVYYDRAYLLLMLSFAEQGRIAIDRENNCARRMEDSETDRRIADPAENVEIVDAYRAELAKLPPIGGLGKNKKGFQ